MGDRHRGGAPAVSPAADPRNGSAEREHAAVAGDEPVAASCRLGHADDRGDRLRLPVDPWNARVAEREDAAVGRNEPVAAAPSASRAIPTIGRLRCIAARRAVEAARRRTRRCRRRTRRASSPCPTASPPSRRSAGSDASRPSSRGSARRRTRRCRRRTRRASSPCPIGVGGHPDDRLVQSASRPSIRGRRGAEREDAAVATRPASSRASGGPAMPTIGCASWQSARASRNSARRRTGRCCRRLAATQ